MLVLDDSTCDSKTAIIRRYKHTLNLKLEMVRALSLSVSVMTSKILYLLKVKLSLYFEDSISMSLYDSPV